MESPGNRRHGLIFQDPASDFNTPTYVRTWPSGESAFNHRSNLSDPNPKYSTGAESSNLMPHNTKSDERHRNSSGINVTLPRSSKSWRSRSSTKNSTSSMPRSLSDSVELVSVNSQSYLQSITDAEKISKLVKTLSGKMRGEVEYQEKNGVNFRGIFYIDEVSGSLMYEGNDQKPYLSTVVTDLRELQVLPIINIEKNLKNLELSNRAMGLQIRFLPVIEAEFDLWLAAFLFWQRNQPEYIPPDFLPLLPSYSSKKGSPRKSKPNNHNSNEVKAANTIKVAKLLLWDSTVSSSTHFMHNLTLKENNLPTRSSWRQVSCTLQDNGQFKLMSENDNIPLSIIQLSQLSRCSVQLLDRSVFDEEFCIAIFPLYASTSTELSFFNNVYIASETRLMHEVWFCLLRAFTSPEMYGRWPSEYDDEYYSSSISSSITAADETFRIEKTIKIRIIEAKFSFNTSTRVKSPQPGKSAKDTTDPAVGDYFVEVVLNEDIRARTSISNDTKTPFWGEDFEFQNLPPQAPSLTIILKKILPLTATPLYSSHPISKTNNLMETCSWTTEIPVICLEQGKDNESWWPILNEQHERAGEIFLYIRYDEMVVLSASDYQPVSELLHNFGSGLTVQISQCIPAKLKAVSELILNIFQASGNSGEWLTTLVEDEIDGIEKETPIDCKVRWSKKLEQEVLSHSVVSDREQTVRDIGRSLQEEANLLFRGNSLLTQALDFHMRRVGKEYLEEVLIEKIAKLNEMNPDCEVDPSRISSNQDINKNWTLLYSLTEDIWESIAGSAERCPSELRQILKYIRIVAEDRYGNFLRIVAYTSVSGFLFLRFFCPALLNPKVFGLLKGQPRFRVQRTLTLIAKSLQALANLSNFGKKESWMEPMNRFLISNRQGMKQYIDSVCAISTKKDTPTIPASYSTPITIYGRITPISREGFPSLPYLIDNAQNFARLIKLWLESTSNEKIESLNGELLQFHQICVKLQHRVENCLQRRENSCSNMHKQSHNAMNNPKTVYNRILVKRDLNPTKTLRTNNSASVNLRLDEQDPTFATGANTWYQNDIQVNNAKEHIKLSDFKNLHERNQMQNTTEMSSISEVHENHYEEWPLKDFLGELG